MAFPDQFIEEIKARVSVSSVVGRRARLIKRGREYVCLSPFSNEKSPSFTINDDKGFYHCFSTGEHGNIFTFLMKTQNLSFPEAVERLAEEAGLELPRQSEQEVQQAEQGARGREAVDAACALYEQVLRAPEGRRGLEYLRSRGLTDETIARFRLGYAPSGNVVKTKFLARGVKEEVLLETRLLSPGKDGRESFDFFRDRVMFPIFDLRGRPVAFGGRVMGDGEPKYLNSPDTPLFHKGQLLYGMALAREAAAKKREIIVAEGYMDVIALAQAGFTNAVAPLGTAMTESQIELLWRMAPEPILCFDGDKAGRGAALRAAERALPLLKPGFSLRFAMMPAGKDPDDICRREGPDAMAQVLREARPLSDVLWQQLLDEHRIDTPERRAALKTAAFAKAKQIADGVVSDQYRSLFDERLRELFRPSSKDNNRYVGKKSNFQPKGNFPPQRRWDFPPDTTPFSGQRTATKLEKIMIAAVLNHISIFDTVVEKMTSLQFTDAGNKQLWAAVLEMMSAAEVSTAADLQGLLSAGGLADRVAELCSADFYKMFGFLKPETSREEALRGWEDAFVRYTSHEFNSEFVSAWASALENGSLEDWERAKAILEERQKLDDIQ